MADLLKRASGLDIERKGKYAGLTMAIVYVLTQVAEHAQASVKWFCTNVQGVQQCWEPLGMVSDPKVQTVLSFAVGMLVFWLVKSHAPKPGDHVISKETKKIVAVVSPGGNVRKSTSGAKEN